MSTNRQEKPLFTLNIKSNGKIFSSQADQQAILDLNPNRMRNDEMSNILNLDTIGTSCGKYSSEMSCNEKKSNFRSKLRRISLKDKAKPLKIKRFSEGEDYIVGIDFNSKAQKKKMKHKVDINLRESIKLGDLTGSITTNATDPIRRSKLQHVNMPMTDPNKQRMKRIDEIDSEFRKFVQSETDFGTITESQRINSRVLSRSEGVDMNSLSDEQVQRIIKEKMKVLDIYNVFVIKKAEDNTAFR